MKFLENVALENVTMEFMDMIFKSGSWEKLTSAERHKFKNLIQVLEREDRIKGSKTIRWENLNTIYQAYLLGLGY